MVKIWSHPLMCEVCSVIWHNICGVIVCACRTCTQTWKNSNLRESTLRKRWKAACCTEGIYTLLLTGFVSTWKMVTEHHHPWRCINIVLKHTRLSNVWLSPLIDCVPDELPDGFSQQMQEESQKSRPRFQPAVQQKLPDPKPKVTTQTTKVWATFTATTNTLFFMNSN